MVKLDAIARRVTRGLGALVVVAVWLSPLEVVGHSEKPHSSRNETPRSEVGPGVAKHDSDRGLLRRLENIVAQGCSIDAVPARRKGLKRRAKPPDYLLPEKDDANPVAESVTPVQAIDGSHYINSLIELRSLYDKGLLDPQDYESAQGRVLSDLSPAAVGVEGGLLFLRQLWDQGLISAAPYAIKRQEMLDAL